MAKLRIPRTRASVLRRRPMKRHLLIIAVLLLLGAVVNVAVAWGCAVWGWRRLDTPVDPAGYRLAVPGAGFVVGELKVGWPIRTFQCGWYHSFEDGTVMFNGWLARDQPDFYEPRLVLPYEPIWLAFAINTIFYAAILWLLIAGALALRRFWRVQQGFCPKCAYPMGESAVST